MTITNTCVADKQQPFFDQHNDACEFIASQGYQVLTHQKSFVKVNDCIIEHLLHTDALSSSEKLYYLANDVYSTFLSSWNKPQLSFAAKKIGDLLGFSKSRVFSIQKSLEAKHYLLINRSSDRFGRNNVNVPTISLPNSVFAQLLLEHQSLHTHHLAIAPAQVQPEHRRQAINVSKLFIPVGFELAKSVLFHKSLSANSKLLFFKIFAIIHKIKQQHRYDSYTATFALSRLEYETNLSKSTILRSLNQLTALHLLRRTKVNSKTDDSTSNKFDRRLYCFEVLIASNSSDLLLPSTVLTNSTNANKLTDLVIGTNIPDNTNINNLDNGSIEGASEGVFNPTGSTTVSKIDPQNVKNRPSIYNYRNKLKKTNKKLDKKVFSNLEGLGIDEVENKLVSKNRGASEDQARSNMLSLLLVKGSEKTRAAEQRRKEEEVEQSSKPTSIAKMAREEIAIGAKKVTTKTRCEGQREGLETGSMGEAEIDIGHRDVLRRFEMAETEKMIEGTWKEEVATKTGSMAVIEGDGQKTLKKVSEVIKKVIKGTTKPESECQEERVGGSYGYTNFNVGNVDSNTRNNKANKNSDKDMSKNNKELDKAAAKNRKVLEKATENKVGKSLGEYYPLRESQIEELKRRSGRGFSPRVINELLLHMSKKYRSYRFKRESNMLSYMSKVLRKEQREESEVNKENYMIKSNYSQEEYKRRCEEYVKVERYFSAIEQEAIVNRSEEGQLRAKLINMLPREVGYELVRNIEEVRIKQLGLGEVKEEGAEWQRGVGDKQIAAAGEEEGEGIEGVVGYRELEGIWEVMRAELVMTKKVEIGEYYQRRVIEQIEAVYGVVIKEVRQIASQEEFKARVERIRGDKMVRNSQASRESDYGKEKQGGELVQEKKAEELKLPENVWGKMRGEIIAEYGEATDRGWFSKLEEVIDEESKEIRLLTPNGFYRDYVEREYSQELNRLRRKYGYKIELVYMG